MEKTFLHGRSRHYGYPTMLGHVPCRREVCNAPTPIGAGICPHTYADLGCAQASLSAPIFRTSPHRPLLLFLPKVHVWQALLTANRILTTGGQPREQAGTLCRGSHLRGPQLVFLVRWQLTLGPGHPGRYRVSIRTRLVIIRIPSCTSH